MRKPPEKPDENTPLLVSYPRCGSHWINALAEVYFDKPRGPDQTGGVTYRPKLPGENYMWFHVHDKQLNTKPSKTTVGDIFLYRNPVHALYSLHKIERVNIVHQATLYKNLMIKWLSTAKTILVYEKAVEDPMKCLEIISSHFEVPFNKEKAKLAIEKCSKENMTSNLPNTKYYNKNILDLTYNNDRETYVKNNNKQIKELVLSETTTPYLEFYFK